MRELIATLLLPSFQVHRHVKVLSVVTCIISARPHPPSLPPHDVVETSQYSAAAAAAVDRSFCPRHSPSVLSLSATVYVRRRNSRLAAVIQYTKASGV